MTDDKKIIDIITRKPVQIINTPEGETAQQFMRRWARTIKDGKFNNIAIIVVDDNNFCDYGTLYSSELKLALFAHMVDDIKKSLKEQLFGEGIYGEEYE